jgi:hypothetical protein
MNLRNKIFVFVFNIEIGQATLLAIVILSIPQLDLLDTANLLEWIFLILFPNYSLGQGLNDIYQNSMLTDLCVELSQLCFRGPNPCCKGKNLFFIDQILVCFFFLL